MCYVLRTCLVQTDNFENSVAYVLSTVLPILTQVSKKDGGNEKGDVI
jgi:hypothetical protein